MRAVVALGAVLLLLAGRAYGDPVLSDTLTVNLKGANPSAVEVEESGLSEFKAAIIDVSKVVGFIGNTGYVLLCEGDTTKCGPNDKFANVSDIITRGTLGGNANVPVFVLYSDPFGDTKDLLTSIFGKNIPAPLCAPIKETGQSQAIGQCFGFNNNNSPKGKDTVLVMSDLDVPEPGTLSVIAAPLLFLMMLASRRGRRHGSYPF